jgi:hypothetical protein
MMICPAGRQPLADLTAAWGLAALRAYLVFSVTIVYDTLKPRFNDPFNNKILAMKNFVSNPSGVNFMVPAITKIKKKMFGPLGFVILRFPFFVFEHRPMFTSPSLGGDSRVRP